MRGNETAQQLIRDEDTKLPDDLQIEFALVAKPPLIQADRCPREGTSGSTSMAAGRLIWFELDKQGSGRVFVVHRQATFIIGMPVLLWIEA